MAKTIPPGGKTDLTNLRALRAYALTHALLGGVYHTYEGIRFRYKIQLCWHRLSVISDPAACTAQRLINRTAEIFRIISSTASSAVTEHRRISVFVGH